MVDTTGLDSRDQNEISSTGCLFRHHICICMIHLVMYRSRILWYIVVNVNLFCKSYLIWPKLDCVFIKKFLAVMLLLINVENFIIYNQKFHKNRINHENVFCVSNLKSACNCYLVGLYQAVVIEYTCLYYICPCRTKTELRGMFSYSGDTAYFRNEASASA